MKRQHRSTRERARLFALHGGLCHLCGGRIQVGEAWDVSHSTPLEMGGSEGDDNALVAHRKCHRAHTSAVDVPAIARAKRLEARHTGTKAPSRRPMPGGRDDKLKRKINGRTVERRDEQ